MRRFVIVPLVAGAALISSILAAPAFSADNGTVNATVQVTGPCITLGGTDITFPATKFSTSTTNAIASVGGPSVTNCGSAAQLHGKGTNATGPSSASWNLVGLASKSGVCGTSGGLLDTNKFALNLYNGGDSFLTTAYAQVSTLAAAASFSGYTFELFMPCTGSSGAGATMSFSVSFLAIVP